MARFTYTLTGATVEIWDAERIGDFANKPMIVQPLAPDGGDWDATIADAWASAQVAELEANLAAASAPPASSKKK